MTRPIKGKFLTCDRCGSQWEVEKFKGEYLCGLCLNPTERLNITQWVDTQIMPGNWIVVTPQTRALELQKERAAAGVVIQDARAGRTGRASRWDQKKEKYKKT